MSNLITSHQSIKIDEIRQSLPFVEGKGCTFKFNQNTPNEFSLLMFFTGKTLVVQYQIQEKQTYHIQLKKQECNFGRFRYWLICPIKGCHKTVGTLYLKNEYFACRTCHKLLYHNQKFKVGLPFYRLGRIEKLLQSKWGKHGEPPKRPKGMHQKTYDHLCGRYLCTILKIKQQGEKNLSNGSTKIKT